MSVYPLDAEDDLFREKIRRGAADFFPLDVSSGKKVQT
jgi:hypothetical protein